MQTPSFQSLPVDVLPLLLNISTENQEISPKEAQKLLHEVIYFGHICKQLHAAINSEAFCHIIIHTFGLKLLFLDAMPSRIDLNWDTFLADRFRILCNWEKGKYSICHTTLNSPKRCLGIAGNEEAIELFFWEDNVHSQLLGHAETRELSVPNLISKSAYRKLHRFETPKKPNFNFAKFPIQSKDYLVLPHPYAEAILLYARNGEFKRQFLIKGKLLDAELKDNYLYAITSMHNTKLNIYQLDLPKSKPKQITLGLRLNYCFGKDYLIYSYGIKNELTAIDLNNLICKNGLSKDNVITKINDKLPESSTLTIFDSGNHFTAITNNFGSLSFYRISIIEKAIQIQRLMRFMRIPSTINLPNMYPTNMHYHLEQVFVTYNQRLCERVSMRKEDFRYDHLEYKNLYSKASAMIPADFNNPLESNPEFLQIGSKVCRVGIDTFSSLVITVLDYNVKDSDLLNLIPVAQHSESLYLHQCSQTGSVWCSI